MPTPSAFKAPFYFNQYYHLLFRSIDGILLFTNDKQREFFLEKFHRFTCSMFNLWSYSQLDNHVHMIIKMKNEEDVKKNILNLPVEEKTKSMRRFLEICNDTTTDEMGERQINSFMVSYANTYNNFIGRKGGLFQQPFRRSLITGDPHLQQAVIYVHANAQKHKLVNDFKKHKHQSFQQIVSGDSLFIDVDEVLAFFGGVNNFIERHDEQVDYFYRNQWPYSKLEND